MLRIAFAFLLLTACVTTPGPGPGGAPAEGEITGEIDKESVRGVIRDHIVPIRHCYEKELKTAPKLSGKLVLEWEIADLGKVTEVTVVKSVQKRLDDCVAGVIKASLFESPPSGKVVRVVYPFHFDPAPEKAVK